MNKLCPKFVDVIKCCGGEDGCTPSLGNYGQRRAAILIPWMMAGKTDPISQDSQWHATSVTHVGAESLLAALGMLGNPALRLCDLMEIYVNVEGAHHFLHRCQMAGGVIVDKKIHQPSSKLVGLFIRGQERMNEDRFH